ncbi:bifunctional demethylmenaquinone methyltransferase/2-methoxy-6-polyprenyl-1,4-benzoquinol methylase [Actinosynnema sp. ALI-1.44]|uniref:demethylmenaquinone methyltransferase n=1 Tax=Actinosynnema sp. ALI-1.44 TaxID=1933779 RepID=UPI00097C11BB|nr:demethylmenaquinone methyltransferase [Actinosynnema sp. ALI-1.44]ONI73239.1 bifunctional demethylmenaquinone methyltransferase/2-methoxy-6-polyprenyl-1,4-benzoquinol methylase [Actinosynnema sp. ALI-1.44]
MSRASLDKKPREVAEMFDGVARRYDRTNSVLTLGYDRRWREMTRRVLDAQPGEKILDLAAGTGVSTVAFARTGAYCVAADFSVGMLSSGAAREIPKVAADAMRLPFADDSFDAVTVVFGIRNFFDTRAALAEMLRVVKPGGRLLVCEFANPKFKPFRALFHWGMKRVAPVIAKVVSSNPEAYRYLGESIKDWHSQRGLAEIVAKAGWGEVEWMNLTFGVVALHRAKKV